MCPVCPGFPAVLAPCLLGGRMLGPGRLVQFGSIGLDQLDEAHLAAVTQRDSSRQEFRSQAVPKLTAPVAHATRPVEQPESCTAS